MVALTEFMVVARIREDADMEAFGATLPAEIARTEEMQGEGLVGAVHVSFPRRTTFLVVRASDVDSARETYERLPLSRFFDADVYPTAAPGAVPAP